MSMVIAARFGSIVEADIACSALQAAGIDAEIYDNIAPGFVSLSAGGPEGRRLMVPDSQLEEAVRILREARPVQPRRVKTPEEKVREAAPILVMGSLLLLPLILWLLRMVVLAFTD